jgi:pyruvate carboxylase
VKVTPSSKVVGDLALYLAGVGADPVDFENRPAAYDLPDSVIGFLEGELGTPPGGWPEPFRTKALEGRSPTAKPVTLSAEDEESLKDPALVRTTLNRLLFPGPSSEREAALATYGDLSSVPTRAFFYGVDPGDEVEVRLAPGVSLFLGVDAIGDADEKGVRLVYCRLNGQNRALSVRDLSATDRTLSREKASLKDPSQVAAPFAGLVTVHVAPGDRIDAGQTVATIEAMKMEAAITSSLAGRVGRVCVEPGATVEGGDLLLTVTTD